MMLIGYKTMHKAMMDMVTVVKVVSEVVVIVVWPKEVKARLFAITVIRQDIYLETARTQLRHVDIAEQPIMRLSNAHS